MRDTQNYTPPACNLQLLIAAKCPISTSAIEIASEMGHTECVELLENALLEYKYLLISNRYSQYIELALIL